MTDSRYRCVYFSRRPYYGDREAIAVQVHNLGVKQIVRLPPLPGLSERHQALVRMTFDALETYPDRSPNVIGPHVTSGAWHPMPAIVDPVAWWRKQAARAE